MTCWAIGDIHGHADKLRALLAKLGYDPLIDQLIFIGDLVNKGPASLATLKLVCALCADNQRNVVLLGNHDIYLLALHHGSLPDRYKHDLHQILNAPERHELLNWLQQQKLAYYHQPSDTVLAHAGIHPHWDLPTALTMAHELELSLRTEPSKDYLAQLFGDEPHDWCQARTRLQRQRFALNALTRMRYLRRSDASLEFATKDCSELYPNAELIAWYKYPGAFVVHQRIVFGHWAALAGSSHDERCINIDAGCAWGGELLALELATGVSLLSG